MTAHDDLAAVREVLVDGCADRCGCDDPGNPSKCIHADRFAALDRLAARLEETEARVRELQAALRDADVLLDIMIGDGPGAVAAYNDARRGVPTSFAGLRAIARQARGVVRAALGEETGP